MSSELLEKEEEYRKINERLELQSKELFREFETVLKKQEDILYDSTIKRQESFNSVYSNNLNSYPKSAGSRKAFSKADIEALPDVEIDPNLVPKSVDEMGVRGMSHFYKTKIKAMQNNFEKLQVEYRMKTDELRVLTNENKRLFEEKERWFNSNNTVKNQLNKLENQLSVLSSKLQAKESENVSLKKELEQLKKELKNLTQNSSSNEVKINRLLEENDKLKTAVQNAKRDENDLKVQHRKQIDDLTNVLKNLEKQKMEVVTAFKKQILLIDNLKRQKTFYESKKMAEIADRDFMKLLELNKNNF